MQTKQIQKVKKKTEKENPMREVKLEKVVLNIGGVGENLEKGHKLLKLITKRTPAKRRSTKRIPTWNVRPNLEVGTVVTIRTGKEELLKRLLIAVDNTLQKKQISKNNFSFGIKEYIEVPGMEYQREIGIMGFDVTVVFKRAGKRVIQKKIKQGHIPERQVIQPAEIIKYMEEHFQTTFR